MIYEFWITLAGKPKLNFSRPVHVPDKVKRWELAEPINRVKYHNFVSCSDGSLYSAVYSKDILEWHLMILHRGLNRSELISDTKVRVEGEIGWVHARNTLFSFYPLDINV